MFEVHDKTIPRLEIISLLDGFYFVITFRLKLNPEATKTTTKPLVVKVRTTVPIQNWFLSRNVMVVLS